MDNHALFSPSHKTPQNSEKANIAKEKESEFCCPKEGGDHWLVAHTLFDRKAVDGGGGGDEAQNGREG